MAARALESLGVSLETTRRRVADTARPDGSAVSGSPPFSPQAQELLDRSSIEARKLGQAEIGTEHVLLSLLRDESGVAVQILADFGEDPFRIRMQVMRLLSGYRPLLEPLAAGEVYEVGDTLSGIVVRAGRTSAAYSEAFDALVRLAGELDVDLEDENVKVEDVRTTSGPGIRLSIEETPPGRRDTNDAGGNAGAGTADAAAGDAENGEDDEPLA